MCRQRLAPQGGAIPLILRSFFKPHLRASTVAASVYDAISRNRDAIALYTDSRTSLVEAIGLRDGTQIAAMERIANECTIFAP